MKYCWRCAYTSGIKEALSPSLRKSNVIGKGYLMYVECFKCKVSGLMCRTEGEAVLAWNVKQDHLRDVDVNANKYLQNFYLS